MVLNRTAPDHDGNPGIVLSAKDVAWFAQTVHQGYHNDSAGSWRDCPKTLCHYSAQLAEKILDAMRQEIARPEDG